MNMQSPPGKPSTQVSHLPPPPPPPPPTQAEQLPKLSPSAVSRGYNSLSLYFLLNDSRQVKRILSRDESTGNRKQSKQDLHEIFFNSQSKCKEVPQSPITAPFSCCPLFYEEYLNLQVRINRIVS